MVTSSVGAVGLQANATSAQSSSGTLGAGLQQQFMRILLAQLQHQDPLSPMQDKDFFAQMAAFTTATQVESLNDKLDKVFEFMVKRYASEEFASAARLIGRQFGAASDQGVFSGVAEAVGLDGGTVVVKSGPHTFPLKDVVWVGGFSDENRGV